MKQRTLMLDMHKLSEDERIEVIGSRVMDLGEAVFMVDADEIDPGKADRYMRKLIEKFPRIYEVSRESGPVHNVTTIKAAVRRT